MIRLSIALFVVALVAWGLLYGVRGSMKAETFAAIRQGLVVLSIAVAILLAVGAFFFFKGFING